MRHLLVWGSGIALLAATVLGGVGCSPGDSPENPGAQDVRAAIRPKTLQAIHSAFPAAETAASSNGPTRIFGSGLATGTDPQDAAERFRKGLGQALGVDDNDLNPRDAQQARPGAHTSAQGIGLMVDEKTGQPKFWLFRYTQSKGGLPVYRAGLHTLVRNDPSNTVVWAASTVRDLASFTPRSSLRPRTPDQNKTLAAVRNTTDFKGRPMPAPTSFSKVSAPELIVFAGTEDHEAEPRMAIQYTAESSTGGKWHIVADADTGDVLNAESQILFADVTGSVTGNATQGDVAMECAPEVATPFMYAEVDGPTTESAFADVNGAYTLSTSATGTVSLTSLMGGQYFDVVNRAGALDQLVSSVVAPATADFVHNAADTDAQVIAQVNGYTNANEIRAFLLKYIPTYPIIATETDFPVDVNLSSADSPLCPGNAFYSGTALNLCLGSSSYTNTSFASVTHHEYGHHIISSGGSGQGEYGEGMADTIATLFSGQHGLGYGFLLNQCTTALRDADNTCQFDASICSSCATSPPAPYTGEIHFCGELLSGTIWSIRKALAVNYPNSYADIINKLTLNSILLHKGTSINSQIAIDLLTLDDDDGTLKNGTPHYNEICSGFTAHGMTCPALQTGMDVSPTSTLVAEGPTAGPFVPASITYTVFNLGPDTTLQYQAALLASTPWLTITNGSGALAIGETAQVTVAIDQTVAAGLAKGGYDATVQFVNQTSSVGSTTRALHLQVGVPVPIYTETFEGGLGSFSLGTEAPNLWHVSSGCASAQSGHSTPKSLYFGIDSTCNYSNSKADAGTATSVPISIADTSAVKLRFNYFLGTEGAGGSWDKATVQVSINDGAYTTVASNGSVGLALKDGSGSWQAAEVDLSPRFAGLTSATMKVRVGFDTIDSVANAYAGFLVDDVQVLAYAGGVVNTAPAVNAGSDQTITLPASASLVGAATDDGLPNPPAALTTAWSEVSGPGAVTFGSMTALSTTAAFSAPGTYVLRLTANDSVLSSMDDLTVTVNPPVNQAPVVNAGADQTITLPAAASLVGTATDDGLPNPPAAITTTWSMVSGPGTVTFANANALATSATFTVAGNYLLRLTASDGQLSSSDDLAVTVNPVQPANQAPVVNAGPDKVVTLSTPAVLTGTASDDGFPNPPGKMTLSWTKVSGPTPDPIIVASADQLTITVTFSVAGVYVFRFSASDGQYTSTDDVTVTVSPAPVNQAPAVNAGPDQAITLPGTANLSGTATDDGLPNPPGILTTTWSRVSGPGTVTFVNPNALATAATFSAAGSYVLRLTASDSALSATDDITITVSPANQAPVVNAGADQTITLPAVANLAGTVTDDGLPNPPATVTKTWSKVSGPGTVTFGTPNALTTTATFSTAGGYVLRLTANDSALASSDDIAVTVNPVATNKAPVVNAGADQTITLPAVANLVGTATDDGLPNPPAVVTKTWSKVSGPGTVTFGNATVLSTTATFSAAGSYVLRLTANDSALSASDDIAITVNAAATTPCAGLCTNPINVTVNGSYQSGNLGTGAVCYQTTSTITGGNCGNFVSPRTLTVNGTTEACSGGNWSSIPAKRNGGYCIQTTSGNQSWAYFTLY